MPSPPVASSRSKALASHTRRLGAGRPLSADWPTVNGVYGAVMRRRGTNSGRSRATGALVVLLTVGLVALIGTVPASAHGADPSVDDVVSGMVPPVPGVTVAVVDSVAPELSATNTTTRPLDVLDRFGDPYLRIGPQGAQGNLNSAEFYRSVDPSGSARVPDRAAKPGSAPTWIQLSKDPSWAWFDERTRGDITSAPPDVVASHRRTTLAVWSIPLAYDGQHARLDGAVVYAPAVGGAAARLTSSLHPAPDLTAALEPGAYPDLFVADSGPDPLLVLGQAGEPFARLGPDGVDVNVLSPVHAADAIARGRTPEAPPNAAAPPQWQHVSGQPSYDWLDPRTRYPGSTPSSQVLLAPGRTVLQHWSVPVEFGTQRLHLDGVVEWVPAPDARTVLASENALPAHQSGSAGRWVVLALVVAAILVGLTVVRIRRRGFPG